MKNKKHFVTMTGIVYLLLAIIPLLWALISLIAILMGEEGMLPFFFGSLIISLGLILIAKYFWEWIEIDEKGISSKRIFKSIYSIEWGKLDKIEKARIKGEVEVEFRFIAIEQNFIVEDYKNIFNKSNGVIKFRPTKAVKKDLIKYCPNHDILINIIEYGFQKRFALNNETNEELSPEVEE
ncbi:MAG: hypothetical protein FWE36_03215 [Erysipelotrichales bacterium]|nr:hypothetical protein [Erysipelotrichales bacterium]